MPIGSNLSKLQLKGTHGTSRSRSDNIKKNGFFTGDGRHGSGVYLWATPIDKEITLYCPEVMLAACFAQDRKLSYKDDNDDSVTVIIGNLSIEESQYLNLKNLDTSKKFESFILKYKDELKKEGNQTNQLKKISEICDKFVRFIEKIENRKILVIHTETEIPKSYKTMCEIDQAYHFWLGFNKTNCYIVRKSELIIIEKYLNIGDAYECYQKQTRQ
ncbi:Uncharacterised protein [uncultured Avibacterium sp.]|uniref:Uncharacterized protein n=1 Tax=uncultured Avibacterium sp. TaxID=1936169 RepID=A0A486XA70_9PAST|nr:Uncharacterised protein [uncultured Avibacterium sp.]